MSPSGFARAGLRGARQALCAAALLPALGCGPLAALGVGASDPMHAEMRRLEKLQQQRASAQLQLEESERERPPQDPRERLRRGDAQLAAGALPDALWEYAAAHRLDPESPAPRVRLGYVHLRSEPERARPLFESALELDPDDVSAHIGLGLALVAAHEADAGISHLERAVALAPRSAKARAALGVSLDRLGRHPEAIAELERARDLRPRDSRILNNLGVSYLRGGEAVRAESALRGALRLDRRDEALRSNNLGIALALQGRYDEALAAFRRGSDEQAALSNLGYVRYLRGEYDAAIEHFERALVVGGEADVEVVRNLEAARSAKRADARGERRRAIPLGGDLVVPAAEVELEAGEEDTGVALEADPEVAPADDPWLRPGPPGALAN